MSGLLRDWLLGIICASMFLALVESLVPEGNAKRMVKLAGRLLLVLVAISPIIKLDENSLRDITKQFEIEVRSESNELEKTNCFLYESIIQKDTAAYILDKAKEIGISCEVSVSVAWDEGVPKPHAVRIIGTWTESQRHTLSELLESELGLPKQMQYFEETE